MILQYTNNAIRHIMSDLCSIIFEKISLAENSNVFPSKTDVQQNQSMLLNCNSRKSI